MAVGYIASVADTQNDTLIATYPWLQLHVADPGAAGTTAVAGNATRKDFSAAFAPSSGGVALSDVQVDWTDAEVDTAETYTHCSFWTAASGGSCGITGIVTASAVNATLNTFSILAGGVSVSHFVAA